MEQSESINELAAALAIAQGQITGALKDSDNPFFKSKYADLASVWDACRKALSENGLAVTQPTTQATDGSGHEYVRTILAHKSGQFISGLLRIKTKDDGPQAQGSGITYARRYALAAMVGVAQVDDDGNAASKGDRSGRPDTSGVDESKRDTFVLGFSEALVNADNTEILRMHDQLKTNAELYTAIFDKLSSKQRTDLRKIISERNKA